MKSVKVKKITRSLSDSLTFPGDKSLSHRAIIFGSLAEGTSRFSNVLNGEDCICTREAFEKMGVRMNVSSDGTTVAVEGVGLDGLKAPSSELYLGNSGTSMRLLMGILAGQNFSATLTGDASLSRRPMKRVGDFLKHMGASIDGRDGGNYAPITVKGGKLSAINAQLPVASAQVKSAILLAGLYADGVTTVTEPVKSRDHTERFLEYFGAKSGTGGTKASVKGGRPRLTKQSFEIAGDISSAAFFMVLSLLIPGSELEFFKVLNNPTRSGIMNVLKRMKAPFGPTHTDVGMGPERAANFSLKSGLFKGFEIQKEELPSLIDEIPILCVLATQGYGRSIIHDADELRVKESDRIEAIKDLLNPMGAKISSEGNTIFIDGPTQLKGTVVNSKKDHRIAMSGVIAGLIADGETVIEDIECIDTSFPTFFTLLKQLKVPFSIG